MAVGQDSRQVIALLPLSQQKWARSLARILQYPATVTHTFKGRLHLFREVAVKHTHLVRVLAFRRNCNPPA